MQWIWVGVNLGCIDAYAVLEWANDMKLYVFDYQTQGQQIPWTFKVHMQSSGL